MSVSVNFADRMFCYNPDMEAKTSIKTLAIWFGAIIVYAFFFQVFYHLMVNNVMWPYPDGKTALNYIVRNTLLILLMFGIGWLIVFKLTNKSLSTPVKIIVDLFFAGLALVAVNILYSYTLKMQFVDWVGTSFNSIITMMALETAYYVQSYRQVLDEREKLDASLREYRYMALRQQVNPHFLFNSLNILYSMVRNASDKSLEFIESLSNFYKCVLKFQDFNLISLEEELYFAKQYFNILSMRYVDQIQVIYLLPEMLTTHRIVPFTIQLLLENVVKHNVMTKSDPMIITISLAGNELMVRNPKRVKSKQLKQGIGLKYLSQMYEIHGQGFRVFDEKDTFSVSVALLD